MISEMILEFRHYANIVKDIDASDIDIVSNIDDDITFKVNVFINNKKESKKETLYKEISKNSSNILFKREVKFIIKNFIYDYLCEMFNVHLPYGSLTGVRPLRLYRDLYEKNHDENETKRLMNELYKVSDNKIALLHDVYMNQKDFYSKKGDLDLYINIPICPTRCSYCSFLSFEKEKMGKLYSLYICALKKEIDYFLDFINKKNKKIRAIYIGGGTPSVLTSAEILDLFGCMKKLDVDEFTFEAGRVDTLDENKIIAIQQIGATRISINPQTFNKKTLDLINRARSIDNIGEIYKMAKAHGFIVNMDVIAMLPNESLSDMVLTIDEILKLRPDEVTIHTLALKSGSKLMIDGYRDVNSANEVNEYAHKKLNCSGYSPYYLYRQKKSASSLENVGFTLNKSEICKYNIDTIEDDTSVLAIGAGAISKKVFSNVKADIIRFGNVGDVAYYVQNIDDIINKKDEFFKDI